MPHEHAPMPTRLRSDDPNAARRSPRQPGRREHAADRDCRHAPAEAGRGEEGAAASARAASWRPTASDIVIDVIIAYTKKAAANYTDIKRELVDLCDRGGQRVVPQ